MGGRERRREGHAGGAELELNFYFLKLNWFYFCFISIFLLCVCACVCHKMRQLRFYAHFPNSEKKNHTMDRKCRIFFWFPTYKIS